MAEIILDSDTTPMGIRILVALLFVKFVKILDMVHTSAIVEIQMLLHPMLSVTYARNLVIQQKPQADLSNYGTMVITFPLSSWLKHSFSATI